MSGLLVLLISEPWRLPKKVNRFAVDLRNRINGNWHIGVVEPGGVQGRPIDMTSSQRITIMLSATLFAAATGALLGQPLAYALVHLIDRDAAEIKSTFLWLIVLTPLVSAAAGFWFAAMATRSSARRSAAWIFAVTVVLGSGIAVASYDPLKTSGIPIIEYELTMPTDIPADSIGSIDFTLWNGKNGQGCYIARVVEQGPKRLVIGSIALSSDNPDPMLSIAFHDGAHWSSGGTWAFRRINRTTIETAFGPWERIDFSGQLRALPLAQGPFEIRYRLRRFI